MAASSIGENVWIRIRYTANGMFFYESCGFSPLALFYYFFCNPTIFRFSLAFRRFFFSFFWFQCISWVLFTLSIAAPSPKLYTKHNFSCFCPYFYRRLDCTRWCCCCCGICGLSAITHAFSFFCCCCCCSIMFGMFDANIKITLVKICNQTVQSLRCVAFIIKD